MWAFFVCVCDFEFIALNHRRIIARPWSALFRF